MTDFRAINVTDIAQISPKDQPAPMLQWVPVESLVIDDSYQRQLSRQNWASIMRIAENFHWSRFTPVLVAPVEGGKFAIIDGQHRTHAAAICGFPEVPAMVVHMPRAEQARAFSWVNGQTIRITQYQILRAALAAGENWAMRADAACATAGCKLMTFHQSSGVKKARQIFSVKLVADLIRRNQDMVVTKALNALVAIDGSNRVALYSDCIIRPLMMALAANPHLMTVDLPAVLQSYDPFKVIDAAANLRADGGTLSDKDAFAKLMDKQLLEAS